MLELSELSEVRSLLDDASPPDVVTAKSGTDAIAAAIRTFASSQDAAYQRFARELASISQAEGVRVGLPSEVQIEHTSLRLSFGQRLPLIATSLDLMDEAETRTPRKDPSVEIPVRLKAKLLLALVERDPSPYTRSMAAHSMVNGHIFPDAATFTDRCAIVELDDAVPALQKGLESVLKPDAGESNTPEEMMLTIDFLATFGGVFRTVAAGPVLTSEAPSIAELQESVGRWSVLVAEATENTQSKAIKERLDVISRVLSGILEEPEIAVEILRSRQAALEGTTALVSAVLEGDRAGLGTITSGNLQNAFVHSEVDPKRVFFGSNYGSDGELLGVTPPSGEPQCPEVIAYLRYTDLNGRIRQVAATITFERTAEERWTPIKSQVESKRGR